MAKGQFKVQKISDIGASNPIMAGLTIGLHDIVAMAQISKKEKDIINSTNLNIAQSLGKAERIGQKICTNIELILADLNKSGVQTQSFERCVNVPSTEGLDDIREVLKYCKHALQEVVKIINLFGNTEYSNPNYKKIYNKLKEIYGANHPVCLQVKEDHDEWLKKLLDLRDCDEHPSMIPEGATVIYSMWGGYLNDRFRDFCANKGLTIEQVHTSGHATVEDLEAFSKAISPKTLIPIHTFEGKQYPEMFENVRILKDGEPFEV